MIASSNQPLDDSKNLSRSFPPSFSQAYPLPRLYPPHPQAPIPLAAEGEEWGKHTESTETSGKDFSEKKRGGQSKRPQESAADGGGAQHEGVRGRGICDTGVRGKRAAAALHPHLMLCTLREKVHLGRGGSCEGREDKIRPGIRICAQSASRRHGACPRSGAEGRCAPAEWECLCLGEGRVRAAGPLC